MNRVLFRLIDFGFVGHDAFPSSVFGVYRRSGNANFRTKYTKPGGWMIKYGCMGNGESDAWFVTNTEASSDQVKPRTGGSGQKEE